MAQFLRPDADVNVASPWTGSYTGIDEVTPSDSDKLTCIGSLNGTCEIGLSNATDPLVSVGHILRVRTSQQNRTNLRTLTVDLFQGVTQKASWLIDPMPKSDNTGTTYEFTLTSGEADSISDYNDLRLRFTSGGNVGTPSGSRAAVYIYWVEFEIPEYSTSVIPTVSTGAVSSVIETGATGNGNITDTGGENATRRGFCFMTGTSGEPTTANSTVYEDGSFNVGAYSLSLGILSENQDYRVRAYAVNSVGTAYGSTVDLKTLAYPTIVLDTADDHDFGTDDTPTLLFTGSDGNSDPITYEIEIGSHSSLAAASEVSDSNTSAEMGSVHLNNISGSGTEDDRPGQSFYGAGGILDKMRMMVGLQGSPVGNMYIKIYEHQGTFGVSSEPLNAVDYADAPTPNHIAISDAFAVPGILTIGNVWQDFTFSGANRILLESGVPYVFILTYSGTGGPSDAPMCAVSAGGTDEGNAYNDGNSAANNGIVSAWEVIFQVYEIPVYIHKVSDIDDGFTNLDTPVDTDPFNAGEQIGFTVQAGDALPITGTYYWRVRPKNPTSGSGNWAGWSAIRSFMVTVTDSNNGILSKTLEALTGAAVATVDITGSTSKTLDSMVSSASGTVDAFGNLSQELAGLSLSGDGTVGSTEDFGELLKTLAGLTLSGIGNIDITGTLEKTLAGLTNNGIGTVEVRGSVSKSLAVLTSNAQGTIEIHASLSLALALITVTAHGTIEVRGIVSKTLPTLISVGDGTVGTITSTGELQQTFAGLSGSGIGNIAVIGNLVRTLATILSTASGMAEVRGLLAKTIGGMSLVASGSLDSVVSSGQLGESLEILSIVAEGAIQAQGELNKSFPGLSLQGSGSVDISGMFSGALSALGGGGIGEVMVGGSLTITLLGLAFIGYNGLISDPLQIYEINEEIRVLYVEHHTLSIQIKGEERKAVFNGRLH